MTACERRWYREHFAYLYFQRFLAFVHSGFKLGILGKKRFQCRHLLLLTLIRKPRQVPLAVTLGIYGYHYRKICELYIL
jgi:hypothetical protein